MANFAQALGSNLAYAVEGEKINLDLEERQQQIAAQKMNMLQAQQQQQQQQKQQDTQQGISQYMQAQMQKDSTIASDPLKIAQLYDQAGAQAMVKGDFKDAEMFGAFSKSARQDAQQQQALIGQKQQAAKESLANAALDFQQAPTAAAADALARAAVNAGVPPSQIPPPGPKLAAFALSHATDAESSKNRLDAASTMQAAARIAEAKAAKDKEDKQLRQQEMSQTAHYQNGMLAAAQVKAAQDRKSEALLTEERQIRVEEARAKQEFGTEKHQALAEATIRAVSTGILDLKKVAELGAGQTGSPFQGLSDKNLMDAFIKTSGTSLTDSQTQMYNSSMSGLGMSLALGEMATSGGGKPSQALMNHFQTSVEAHPGDSPSTAAYKYALVADRFRNLLENTGKVRDPAKQKSRESAEAWLETAPTASQVIASVRKHKGEAAADKIVQQGGTMQQQLDSMVAANAAENPTPTPASDGLSQSDNDLINKYLKK